MNASPSHPSHHFDDYFNNIHNVLFWGTVTLQSLSKPGFVLTSNVAWHCNWSGPKQRLWELGGRERRWNRNRRWGIHTVLKNPSQVLTITMIMGVDAQGSPPGVAHLLKVILALLGYWLSSLFPSTPVTRVDALQAAFSALNCFILRQTKHHLWFYQVHLWNLPIGIVLWPVLSYAEAVFSV